MVSTGRAHNDYFLSCDWGTSSFRLYLVRSSDNEIRAEITSGKGVKVVYEKWQENTSSDREEVFRKVLKEHIDLLALKSGKDLYDVPVVISGMISSSIGWRELPYAVLPFPLDGQLIKFDQIPANKSFPHEVILTSGVCKDTEDIMRGEETQLIGLIDLVDCKEGRFILPGTHSKHIFIKEGQITDFKTFMTGELFAIISEHSILNASLLKSNDFAEHYFEEGVNKSLMGNFLHELFSIRTRSVTTRSKISSDFLSGMLIGHELSELQDRSENIIICADTIMAERYELALRCIGPDLSYQIVSTDLMKKSIVYGHKKIIRNTINY